MSLRCRGVRLLSCGRSVLASAESLKSLCNLLNEKVDLGEAVRLGCVVTLSFPWRAARRGRRIDKQAFRPQQRREIALRASAAPAERVSPDQRRAAPKEADHVLAAELRLAQGRCDFRDGGVAFVPRRLAPALDVDSLVEPALAAAEEDLEIERRTLLLEKAA